MLTRLTIMIWILAAFVAGNALACYTAQPVHVTAVKYIDRAVYQHVPNAARFNAQAERLALAIPKSALDYRGRR